MATTTNSRSRKASTPHAAAVYARISLDRKGEALGVERQEQLCRELAEKRDWPVAEVYVDNDVSAHSRKPRPSYERLLRDLEAGVRDAVIVVDLDRLTRRPMELERFVELADERGIALANVEGEIDLSVSDGRFRARILGAVARMEGEKKSERMQRESGQAAYRGIPRGSHRPYGYEPDRVTIRESEAELIREAVDRVLAGETIPSVARDFNARGIPSPQAAANGWRVSSLTSILRSARYAGLRSFKGEVVADGTWPGIIDRETFDRLQARVRRTARVGQPPRRLLSAFLKCGRCGSPMWASHRYNKLGERVERYACVSRPGHSGCGKSTVVGPPLDRLVENMVIVKIENTRGAKRGLQAKPPKRARADDTLAKVERALEDLAADFANPALKMDRREWLAAREPLKEQQARLQRAVDEDAGLAALAPFADATDVRAVWDGLDIDRKRAVIAALLNKVTVAPSRKGVNAFDKDRIDPDWR